MAITTITGMTGATSTDVVGTAVAPLDLTESGSLVTRKATLATLRTRMFAGGTGFTSTDPLVAGTIGGTTITASVALAGTLSTAAQPNVTSVGTLTSLTVSGTLASGAFNPTSDITLVNTAFLFGKNSSGVAKSLIGVTAGNVVSIDASALGATFGAGITVANGLTVSAGTTAVQALTATTALVTAANGALVRANNTSAAGLNGAIELQRGSVVRYYIGFNASDEFAVTNAAASQVNLSITDAGAGTFRAGLTLAGALSGVTTLTMSSTLNMGAGNLVTTGDIRMDGGSLYVDYSEGTRFVRNTLNQVAGYVGGFEWIAAVNTAGNRPNVGLTTSSISAGGGEGVVFIGNTTTNPSTNPTGGGILYADAGAGKWRGSGGTVTTFGPAEPHCSACGSDFGWEWESETYGYLHVCAQCLANELGNRAWIARAKRVA